MLNMEALERALQSIENTAHVESTFPVGGDDGVLVTLGLILPDEEVEVQRYAQEALSDDSDGNSTKDEAMDFLDRWKYGILSYAVRQIGDLDLRDQEHIATGETTDSGVAVKVPRHVAVRKLLRKIWHRPILNRVFHKYTELLGEGEAKAAKAIKYKPADLDAEITRREQELEGLKEQKRHQEGAPDPVGNQIRQTTELAQAAGEAGMDTGGTAQSITAGENRAARRKREREEKKARGKAKGKPKPKAAPTGRMSAIPSRGAAPARAPEPPPAPAPPAVSMDIGSFGDADDEAVLAAETQRLLAARAAAAQAEKEGTNVPGPEHEARVAAAKARHPRMPEGMVPREPPHRQAASTAAAVLDSGGGTIQPARPEHVGSVDGVNAHRIKPPETLTRRGQPKKPGQKRETAPLNEGPKGSTNPHFKPSR